ncbi:MAG: SRPBCC family protein [Actinomycetota bacterium]
MLDIKQTRTIHAPIEEVWRVVVDGFTDSHEWAFGTTMCRPGTDAEGVDRVCDTESGRLMDTITTVDPEARLLEFEVEGLPFFVRSVVSTWTMVDLGDDRTDLTIGPRIETLPVIGRLFEIPMRRALTALYPELLDDLAVYIETGAPSDRKRAELAASR